MHTLNLLSKSIAKVKISGFLMQRFLLGASVTLILSSMAFAAAPINDTELTNNFLSNDVSISKIASAQLIQNDYLNQEFEEKQLKDIATKSTAIPDNLDPTVQKSFVLVSDEGGEAVESANIIDRIIEPDRIITFKVPWVDDEGNNGGTRRIPCLIDQDLKITYIDETLPKSAVSDIMKINVNGLMAGEWEGLPMVYNHKTGERKSIKIYDGFYAGAFEDISDNGIAVGYMTTMNSANQLVREAVIWHESFGDQVQLLSDYVKKAGFSIDTYDGMMGTALTISNNGKYIGGYDNSAFNFGRGWVVKLNEKLLNTNESVKYTSNINVYPTLVTSTLNISSDYIINQYTITTIDGKVVKKSNLNNIKEKIEVSSLSKGIYIITINSNHTTKSVKFIKQ